MIVAMAVVWVMQAAVHQIINMIAVRDSRVTAIGAAAAGTFDRRTDIRVGLADFDNVLVVVALMREVQMAVVQVADMIAVLDAQVAAGFTVDMDMISMDGMGHGLTPFFLQVLSVIEDLLVKVLDMLIG
jgi:hypothetical protein